MTTDVDNLPHGTDPDGLESVMIKQGGVWKEVTLDEFFRRAAQASGIGGSFNLIGGDGANGQGGGSFGFTGGKGAGGSSGGSVSLQGGEGGPSGGRGGDVSLKGGAGGNGTHGGAVVIEGGEPGPDGGQRGPVYASNLPTEDPRDFGALWNGAGVVRISEG